ncbi:lipid A biosynthesis acyltransferase [Paucibacter sp. DJ2R-2]|uniref:LpxL/LpxP family acyltransferase n=1 Tax=Paucibacter sp. DJ2R-2 TaxID=2893558 RepID=UPI0021E4E48F|nr:lipid A biosynthesis acyltransferase [Paucibacter sp. DJ2R-2]MCV2419884.1 lipid A biosynthesis acyltransferase [Paucibacter sp. DJ4R-1]MCV2437213.1 lipid A biosynthesis acyltransferase [Paucibacter sp. DJ2R-2]
MLSTWGAKFLIGLLWLLHFLPLSLLAALGRGLGSLLWVLARSRRRIALRNLELCFPELDAAQRQALAREHFAWMGRSVLERGLLWFAPAERLQRLMEIKGDIQLAQRGETPVMWLLPHFAGLEWSAPALMLNQSCPGVDVYSRQSNPVFDAQLLAGRARFGKTAFVDRHDGIRPVLRLIREGYAFLNAPDMDFGAKDSAFIPFFGVPACTLLAPAKIARSMGMTVQPLVVTMKPGGQGYLIEAFAPPAGYPSGDLEADARVLNAWLEARIRENPAQYLWVHKRFKTRPEGAPSLY